MIPKTPGELITRLSQNSNVLGILRYGSRDAFEGRVGGDVDLFVIVKERPDEVESLHFHVGHTPVDLNLRTLADLHRQMPLTEIDDAIREAEAIFERGETVATALVQIKKHASAPLTDNKIAWDRFCQQHVIDKVKGRLESNPILCALLLNTNIYWLIHAYFRVRRLPYKGEKAALNWLQRNAEEIFELIKRFYQTHVLSEQLSITEDLTDRVLEPIGGRWKRGELITFGTTDGVENLNEKGEAFFKALIMKSANIGFDTT